MSGPRIDLPFRDTLGARARLRADAYGDRPGVGPILLSLFDLSMNGPLAVLVTMTMLVSAVASFLVPLMIGRGLRSMEVAVVAMLVMAVVQIGVGGWIYREFLVHCHRVVGIASERPTKWRLLLLRLFGAKIHGYPFISASAKIKRPWDLEIHDRACVSPGAEIYNLGGCILRARANVTQYAYLCGGTHDLSDPGLPLVVGMIDVGEDVFIGARAMVLPGITLGTGSVVGAGSVVTRDVAPWMIVAGNPARPIRARAHPGAPRDGTAPA